VFVGENDRNWIIMHWMENINLKLFMNQTNVLHQGMSGTLVEHILAWYFVFLVTVLNKASTDHVYYTASNTVTVTHYRCSSWLQTQNSGRNYPGWKMKNKWKNICMHKSTSWNMQCDIVCHYTK
jgi:hypothetical protein